jgi:hypothetical protein
MEQHNSGRLTTQQPVTIGANTQQRVQLSYAMEAEQGNNTGNDKCYEGMLTCLGGIFGFIGSIPCCCFFPKYFISNF